MPNCKYCNTPLPENETGRRPREFCDNKQKCRNLWHRKNKKEKSITIPIDQWKDIQAKLLENKDINFEKTVSVLFNNGNNKINPVKLDAIAVPNNEHITVTYQEPKNTNPKNLDQLKLLCPKELTGFDRSEWIRTERLKYSI